MRVHANMVQKRKRVEETNAHAIWGELLIILGLIGTLAGSQDPLEGAAFILPGVALISLGTILSKSRLKWFAFWSCVLTAIGIFAMIVLSALGGIGGDSGLSIWWTALLVPYAVGAALSFIGGVMALLEGLNNDGNSAQTQR
jgi:hypothetical protein